MPLLPQPLCEVHMTFDELRRQIEESCGMDGEAVLRFWVDAVCESAIEEARAYCEVQELERILVMKPQENPITPKGGNGE